jgi:hemerythrin
MLWNKSLETGIPKIDEQHKELFRAVDVLVDRSQGDRVEKTLNFLKGYVAKHFSDEEIMHRISNYPKAAVHKQLHVNFAKTFQGLFDEYNKATGSKLLVVMKINKIAIGWLKDHIMVHDKDFANFYLAKRQPQPHQPQPLRK